jgi:tetratricopeptide (TPR) repeat protein
MAGALGAKVLHGAGWLAVQQRDYAQGTTLLEQSLVRAEEAQDTERTIAVLHDLAQAARLQGDHDRAVTLFTQAAALGRESGDTRLLGRSLGNLGVVAHAGSDKAQAANLLTAGLDLMRALGDKVYMGWFLSFLGRVEKDRGDYEQAATCLAESLTLFRDLEDRNGIAFVLEGFAGLAGAQGAGARAAHLFGVVAALRLTINLPVSPFDQPEYDRDMASIRDQLDDVAFAAAWAAGQAMTLEQAIAFALDGSR